MSRWKSIQQEEEKIVKTEEAEAQPEEQEEPIGMEAVEEGFKEELDAALVAFMDRRKKETKRFADIVDSNFYFCVCFSNQEQMLEFCEKFGLNPDLRYYDGREIAKAFKKALVTPDSSIPKEKGRSKDYEARALKPNLF